MESDAFVLAAVTSSVWCLMLGPYKIILTRASNDCGTLFCKDSSPNVPLNEKVWLNISFLTIFAACAKCIASLSLS